MNALSATIGMTPQELREYRYHAGKTSRAVYAIGDVYYTQGKTRPVMLGMDWIKHSDQYHAERANTSIWTAKSNHQ
jgi:hypothetical protein